MAQRIAIAERLDADEALARVKTIARASKSMETNVGYDSVVANYEATMKHAAIDASVEDVRTYLLILGVRIDDETGEILVDEDGSLIRNLHPVTVTRALAAIDDACSRAGRPRPGADAETRLMVLGLRRMFGVLADNPRDPLLLEDIRLLMAAARVLSPAVWRRRMAVLLHRLTGASAGQIWRLRGNDVVVSPSEVVITLPPGSRGKAPTVRLPRRGAAEVLAIEVQPLAVARGAGFLLGHSDGTQLNRQHCYDLLADARAEMGGGWPGTRQLVRALDAIAPRLDVDLTVLRDCTLLSLGFFTAMRRGSLSRLRFADLTRLPDGWRVRLVREKSNRSPRHARYITCGWTPDDDACPTVALDRYVAAILAGAGATEVSQIAEWPVFPVIDRHGAMRVKGETPQAMSGEAINERIQELCVRAGLMDRLTGDGTRARFGAHSLRAGLVTALINAGVPFEKIMEITGHRQYATVRAYDRPRDARASVATSALLGSETAGAPPMSRRPGPMTAANLAAQRRR